MATYNLDKPVTNYQGEIIKDGEKDLMLWKPLSIVLSENSSENYLKHIGWVMSLAKDKALTLDEEDKLQLLNFIKNNKSLVDLVKYQIYQAIKD